MGGRCRCFVAHMDQHLLLLKIADAVVPLPISPSEQKDAPAQRAAQSFQRGDAHVAELSGGDIAGDIVRIIGNA